METTAHDRALQLVGDEADETEALVHSFPFAPLRGADVSLVACLRSGGWHVE